ncbi:FAD-dependent thymidylate synthase [bacterium]|nr:MAG: FAD-dependent thymidylate synthase [bacterium]
MGRLSVEILAHTPTPERAVAVAARLCYSPRSVSELAEALTDAEVEKLVGKITSMGHFSTLEHAVFTFGIDGISRACSHQLVRHRVASYSQQSQRYVELKKVEAVIPPSISKSKKSRALFEKKLEEIWKLYGELVEGGVPAEDARYILPNACETKIVVTMNARELHHFFALRLCTRAQWEIREMAKEMYRAAYAVSPLLFSGAGPGCVRGKCTEGEYCCGQQKKVRAELKKLLA